MANLLPLTEIWPMSCHLPKAIVQSTAFVRYMDWNLFTVSWMIVIYSWWYQNTTLAARNLLLSYITLHMLHILVPEKHLQHCSNISGGQVCNVMYVSMLLDVLFVKGLRMLTWHLQGYCNQCQY